MNKTSEMESLGFHPEDQRKWYFVSPREKTVLSEKEERGTAQVLLDIAMDLQPGCKTTQVLAVGEEHCGEFVVVFGRVPKFGTASRLRKAVEKASHGQFTAGKYQFCILASRYGYGYEAA